MKKKIIIGLTIFSIFFLIGGIYIISTIETSTSTLDNLITLHQVEILREHLLIQIKRVQSDIHLKNTRFARKTDTIIANVQSMEYVANSCFGCHHTSDVYHRLTNLKKEIVEYKKTISRVFTISANTLRLEEEENRAFLKGEELVSMVNNMISMASTNLELKTNASLKDIARTKTVLYILVSLGPISTAILAIIFITGFNKPINILLQATRKLKERDLNYKIEGLTGEFGEVAASMNEMSNSLNEYMHKIQESEKRYRLLFESAGDAIFILDTEGENAGRIISANKAAAEMHGYTVDELLEMNIVRDIDIPEAAKDAEERIQRIMNGEWIKEETTHLRKDGTIFPVEISAGLFEFMNHKYILAFDRDISQRKKAEEKVREQVEFLHTLMNTIPLPIFYKDKNGSYTGCNNAFEDLTGTPRAQIIGKTVYAHAPKEIADMFNKKDQELFKTPGKQIYESRIKKGDNDIRDVIFYKASFLDAKNEVSGLIGTILDITERKHTESVLQRAEQMKIVGELAAGFAHEIKNPLTGIKAIVEVLSQEPSLSMDDRDSITKTIEEIKRIESLIKNLLNFAKPPKPFMLETSINEVLDKTLVFVMKYPAISANTTIKVTKDYDTNIPHTMADPFQLQQIFMNLLLNAVDSLSDKGGIISLKTLYDSSLHLIVIEISDTGEGLDRETKEKIFQPFFTTRTKGTGLGLAITKRLVEQHGGDISVTSTQGEGAIFRISLPVRSGIEVKTT